MGHLWGIEVEILVKDGSYTELFTGSELENQTRIPQNLPDALRLAADLAEEKLQLENQLAIVAPKVQFVDSYVNSTGSLGFRETCKLLHIKEPAFRKFLLDSEIMFLLAGKLTPYAQYIDAGRFTVKTSENQTNGHAFTQNKFTPNPTTNMQDYIRYKTSGYTISEGEPVKPKKFEMLYVRDAYQARDRAIKEVRRLLYSRITAAITAMADGV